MERIDVAVVDERRCARDNAAARDGRARPDVALRYLRARGDGTRARGAEYDAPPPRRNSGSIPQR